MKSTRLRYTYFANTFEHSNADYVRGSHPGGQRRQHGKYGCQKNADAEHVFASVSLREHAARDLCKHVSVIESAEDMTLKRFGPIEFGVLRAT